MRERECVCVYSCVRAYVCACMRACVCVRRPEEASEGPRGRGVELCQSVCVCMFVSESPSVCVRAWCQ